MFEFIFCLAALLPSPSLPVAALPAALPLSAMQPAAVPDATMLRDLAGWQRWLDGRPQEAWVLGTAAHAELAGGLARALEWAGAGGPRRMTGMADRIDPFTVVIRDLDPGNHAALLRPGQEEEAIDLLPLIFSLPLSGSADGVPAVMDMYFSGYGLDRRGVDDYAGTDLAGGMAVVLAGLPGLLAAEPVADLLQEKMEVAVRHGAGALLILDDELQLSPRSQKAAAPGAPVPSLASYLQYPLQARPPGIEADRQVARHYAWLDLPPGLVPNLPLLAGGSQAIGRLLAARSLLAARQERRWTPGAGPVRLPGRLAIRAGFQWRSYRGANVIGVLEPRRPNSQRPVVLAAAVAGNDARVSAGLPAAALLEAAILVAGQRQNLHRPVVVAFLDATDWGEAGAQRLHRQIRAMQHAPASSVVMLEAAPVGTAGLVLHSISAAAEAGALNLLASMQLPVRVADASTLGPPSELEAGAAASVRLAIGDKVTVSGAARAAAALALAAADGDF